MHIFPIILLLNVCTFGNCLRTRQNDPHMESHSPPEAIIQPLEPVLLPPGTFIAQSFLDLNATEADHENDITPLLTEAIAQAIPEGQVMRKKRDVGTTLAPENGQVLSLYGIKPLTTVSVPMGIFIPGQPDNSSSATKERMDVRRKMLTKFKMIFHSLGSFQKGNNLRQFRYSEVFGAIVPLKALYVPKGHLIPLSRIPGSSGLTNVHTNNSSTQSFAGITPLTIVRMPGGIFIPHPVNNLPDIPGGLPLPVSTEIPSTTPSSNPSTSVSVSSLATSLSDTTAISPLEASTSTAFFGSTSPVTVLSLPIPPEAVEEAFRHWVETDYNPKTESVLSKYYSACWDFETRISDETKKALITSTTSVQELRATMASSLSRFPLESIKDPTLKRLYHKISKGSDEILNSVKYNQLQIFKADMMKTFSTAKVCSDTCTPADNLDACPKENHWSLVPDITNAMANSRNQTLLLHLWTSWRDAVGKPNKNNFIRYVQLKNEAAKLNGHKSAGAAWRESFIEEEYDYTDKSFLEDIRDLFKQVFPLYQQLHAYIRRKLISKYPDAGIKPNGPIPAHLLGHINALSWSALNDFAKPYPQRLATDEVNIDAQFAAKGWANEKMYQTAEKFFADLGLDPFPDTCWKNSVFSKTAGHEMVCDPSSFDFLNRTDFRMKLCMSASLKDFHTIHHEMGRLQYAMAYRNQYVPFRNGPNAAFVEAVGDAISLSVTTPKYLQKTGLLDEEQVGMLSGPVGSINFLFAMALDKIAMLPFAYIVDKYRYDVFDGRVTMNDLNSKWWMNVIKFQGICPPEPRTEDNFDPSALYQINADIPYIRYFISTILQFQIQKALCGITGQAEPFHECSVDGSKEVGKLLKEVMTLGSSTPWQTIMKKLTGTTKLDATPLLDYFRPLHEWLERDNIQHNVFTGWEESVTCGNTK